MKTVSKVLFFLLIAEIFTGYWLLFPSLFSFLSIFYNRTALFNLHLVLPLLILVFTAIHIGEEK